MTLYVTRHGETEWNAKHIISGLAEIPLSEKGRLQAASLAARLAEHQNDYRIKHILVSPLGRARETASYIEKALGIDAVVEERLHEIDFGAFEHTSTQGAEFLAIKANPSRRRIAALCRLPRLRSYRRRARALRSRQYTLRVSRYAFGAYQHVLSGLRNHRRIHEQRL